MPKLPRFFTEVQATGVLTLGNYCGLIHHILKIQKDYEVIIMIADLHALTVPKKDFNYLQKGREMAALLYACGLQIENCKIFIQSEIKEHLELFWLLSPHITVGRLGDMIQFKDKTKKEGTGNLALLSYPVLMAADIFLYDTDLVIVGQDQQQHLELATDIAQRFNNFYNYELLNVKKIKLTIPDLGTKIMGLKDPRKKMSKSGDEYIGLLDKPEEITKKIKKALTDGETEIHYDLEKRPGISNLLTIYTLLKNQKIEESVKELQGLNHEQFKTKLANLLNEKLTPIQKKYHLYLPKIREILEKNNQYLKSLAEKKMREIKSELKL